MIEAREIYLKYPDGTTALKNISLQIKPGELLYVIGPSGSGKTSLLKLIMGIEFPSKGILKVFGQAVNKGNAAGIRRLRRMIGPVFQDFKLIDGRTAMENVMLGTRFLGVTPHQMKDSAIKALIKVGLEHKAFSPVENLSWGERQRVSIARAVSRNPLLILADEPTGNLDRDNALKILGLLTSFRNENTSVVITTHATHLIDEKEDCRCIQLDMGTIYREMKGWVQD
ncbi:MAG: ABC transporter [Firmicutes bacterium HGW-Firmicutes-13]|nr:MAG: ABC transporter [Firmicutes bacterium HGW-Firmicutes-13]